MAEQELHKGEPEEAFQLPDVIRSQVADDEFAMHDLAIHFENAANYAIGYENLLKTELPDSLHTHLLAAMEGHLNTSVAQLLTPKNPNSKAGEASAMVCEVGLKSILVKAFGYTDALLRKKFSHDLVALMEECSQIRPGLDLLLGEIQVFPRIEARYQAMKITNDDLWRGHQVAQCLAAVAVDVALDSSIQAK